MLIFPLISNAGRRLQLHLLSQVQDIGPPALDITMASQSVEYSNQGALEGLPFLVTHWLANFESGGGSNSDEEQRAIDRIRNASAEIASAFASLGAFGTTIRVGFK